MKLIILIVACIAAATLPWTPTIAATVPLSDEELDAISGLANSVNIADVNSTIISGINMNGSIQVGSFQWQDNHNQDLSINKGANVQSGNESQVQQYVIANANALAWGAVAQSVTINTNSPVHGDQVTSSYAILFIGGF
jgi:hypothetical protein